MGKKRAREIPEQERRVVAMFNGESRLANNADKPAAAGVFLDAALANHSLRGVFVVTVGADGLCDVRVFGKVTKMECAWIGAKALHLSQVRWNDE